jgi:hypothetical protein
MRVVACVLTSALTVSGCMTQERGTEDAVFVKAAPDRVSSTSMLDYIVDGDARPAIRIEFTMTGNLQKIATKSEFHIGVDASFCSNGEYDERRSISAFPALHDSLGEVDAYRGDPTKGPATGPQGSYFFYVETLSRYTPRAVRSTTTDFATNTRDVCFFVRGGNILGTAFRSNTVVVPAAALAAAIKSPRQITPPKALADATAYFEELAEAIQYSEIRNLDVVAISYDTALGSAPPPEDFEKANLPAYRCRLSLDDRQSGQLAAALKQSKFAPHFGYENLFWRVNFLMNDKTRYSFLMGRSYDNSSVVGVMVAGTIVDTRKSLVTWFERSIDFSRCTPPPN